MDSCYFLPVNSTTGGGQWGNSLWIGSTLVKGVTYFSLWMSFRSRCLTVTFQVIYFEPEAAQPEDDDEEQGHMVSPQRRDRGDMPPSPSEDPKEVPDDRLKNRSLPLPTHEEAKERGVQGFTEFIGRLPNLSSGRNVQSVILSNQHLRHLLSPGTALTRACCAGSRCSVGHQALASFLVSAFILL